MTEEVIIDGVNVAGCKDYRKIEYKEMPVCMNYYNHLPKPPKETEWQYCAGNKNCYYKQIKRLEQENKELKIKLSSTKCYLCGEGFLTPEGAELYEEKEKYKTALIELRKDFNNFRFTIIPFHVGAKEVLPHKLVDVIQDYCIEIENRIHEVLKK